MKGILTRHCINCSKDYGCTENNGEKHECRYCEYEPAYCGANNKPTTGGICEKCWETRKDQSARHFQ